MRASGATHGLHQLWDLRQQRAVREYAVQEDFVSDFAYVEDKQMLLATRCVRPGSGGAQAPSSR